MATEIILVVALACAAFGAILSTVKGYWGSEKPYSGKKMVSALVTSVLTAFTLVNVQQLAGMESSGTYAVISTAIAYLIIGYGIDQGVSDLDK